MDALNTIAKQYFVMYPLRYVNLIEECCDEVLDDLYTEYTDLLSQKDSELCFKTYFLPDGTHISLLESTNLISDGTTGLNTWQAAQYLAEWVLEERALFTDKCVLELGSGVGLTGLTVCRQCHPSCFIFSDCHTKVLSLLKQNIAHNTKAATSVNAARLSPSAQSKSSITNESRTETQTQEEPCEESVNRPSPSDEWHTLKQNEAVAAWSEKTTDEVSIFTNVNCSPTVVWQLDWETVKDETIHHLSSDIDIVLAADVVYDESIIPALVRMLSIMLQGGSNRKAYVASTVRNKQTRDKFLQSLEMASIAWQMLPAPKRPVFYFDRSVPIEIINLWHLNTEDHKK